MEAPPNVDEGNTAVGGNYEVEAQGGGNGPPTPPNPEQCEEHVNGTALMSNDASILRKVILDVTAAVHRHITKSEKRILKELENRRKDHV